MDYNHFFTNDEIDQALQGWAAAYPELIQLARIGSSHEGRPVWLATLTNRTAGSDLDKPAVWVDANIHATELSGSTVVLYLLENLLQGYGKDPQITRLMDTCTFYVVPRINPDGAALAMAASPRFIRSGVRPYPWAELDEGLHVQDVDSDGRVLQMRIPDPNGDWKISTRDTRLMEKRGPAEQGGSYYRVLPEGLLEDYDGYVIKMARPQQGLDFNRNFPFDWRPEADQHGAGPFPASEPEIRAVVDFVAHHPNINAGLTFHTFSRVILRPYSTRSDDDMNQGDLWTYKQIGQLGTQITGYPNVSVYHDFRTEPKDLTTGAFDDWLYDNLGCFAFTVEIWDLPAQAGIQNRKYFEWFRQHPFEDDLKIIQWVDANIGPSGYAPWVAFNHPQLGPVELGGWDLLYTWRNPPPAVIGEEARRHLPFILATAELLPHVALQGLQVKALSADTFSVNLVVENTGYLPTFTSAQAKKRKVVRPVRVELSLPEGAHLVSGKASLELSHLEGRSNKQDVSTVFAASPTDNRARAEWVIQAPAGSVLTLAVHSERAGSWEQKVTLV